MKHIKFFETIEDEYEYINKIFTNATKYLEINQPISKKNGFIECLYDIDAYDKFDHRFTLISFYFNNNFDYDEKNNQSGDKYFNILKNYLDENDLEIYDCKITASDLFEIIVKLSLEKVKEYSKLYIDIKNYNL